MNHPFGKKLIKLLNHPHTHLAAAFLVWIFFSTVRSYSFLLASSCSVVLMTFLNFRELKKGFVLPWGSILVFATLGLNHLFVFSTWTLDHNFLIINSATAAIIWFSMAIGKPFTLQYARESVDPSRWNHPTFLKINWVLTALWAILMTISALPVYLLSKEAVNSSWFWNYGLNILCVLIGVRCNKLIPKLFLKT